MYRSSHPAIPLRLLGILLVALSHRMPAQPPAAEPARPAAAPVEPSPRAIPVPEIAESSTELASTLRATNAHAQPDPRITEIGNSLKDYSTAVLDLAAYSRDVIRGSPGVDKANELLTTWRPITARLSEWSARLRDRARDLEQDKTLLTRAEQSWNLTLQGPDFAELPDEVKARVSTLLQAVHSSQQANAERRNAVLLLQSEIAALRVQAESVVEEIENAEKQERVGLFAFDSGPIWQKPNPPPPPSAGPMKLEVSSESRNWMRDYVVTVLARLIMFGVLAFLAWLSLRRLRSHAGAWEQSPDENVRSLSIVARRSVSAALFVAVLLCAIFVRNVPAWQVGLVGVILLVPSLRLLPQLIAHNLRRPFYVLVALLVTSSLVNLIPPSSPWSRPLWLVVQILIVVSFIWLFGVLRGRATPGYWAAGIRIATVLAIGIGIFASIANIAGMADLAKFAARTVLVTFYAAIIIRGMVVILTGLVIAGLRTDRFTFMAPFLERRKRVERRAIRALNLLAIVAFTMVFLYLTTLLDPVRGGLESLLATEFRFGAISLTLYNLVTFVLVVIGTVVISNVLRFGMEVGVYPRFDLQIGQKDAFSKILHYCVILLGFVFAVTAAGVELSNVAILLGGLSVGIGLGLQNVVNNFVSGLILLFERPLQVGDLVKVKAAEGVVRNIGIRASIIRSWEGADVIVPNAELISTDLINWTHSGSHRRVDILIGAAYGASPAQVIEILTKVARDHKQVLRDPAPVTVFTGFGEFSQDFILRFWCDVTEWVAVGSEIRGQIIDAFHDANIEIPFPQRNLHVRVMKGE